MLWGCSVLDLNFIKCQVSLLLSTFLQIGGGEYCQNILTHSIVCTENDQIQKLTTVGRLEKVFKYNKFPIDTLFAGK